MEAVAFGGRDISDGGGSGNVLDFNATSNIYNMVINVHYIIYLLIVVIEDLRFI